MNKEKRITTGRKVLGHSMHPKNIYELRESPPKILGEILKDTTFTDKKSKYLLVGARAIDQHRPGADYVVGLYESAEVKCPEMFDETMALANWLLSVAAFRGKSKKPFCIKPRHKVEADGKVLKLFRKYVFSKTENATDMLHGIWLARDEVRANKKSYDLATYISDLEYYSDRWCAWRVSKMLVIWEYILRLR